MYFSSLSKKKKGQEKNILIYLCQFLKNVKNSTQISINTCDKSFSFGSKVLLGNVLLVYFTHIVSRNLINKLENTWNFMFR